MLSGITLVGPSTKMWGFWWDCSAWLVACGIPERDTNRIGLPLSAAQPAAGIAYWGSSPDAITTSLEALPAAALAKRSIAAASL